MDSHLSWKSAQTAYDSVCTWCKVSNTTPYSPYILYAGIKACMAAMKPVSEEQFEISTDVHGINNGPRFGRLRVMNKVILSSISLVCFYMSDREDAEEWMIICFAAYLGLVLNTLCRIIVLVSYSPSWINISTILFQSDLRISWSHVFSILPQWSISTTILLRTDLNL